MPITDVNGSKINEKDQKALQDMLKGSLENHIDELSTWKRTAEQRGEDPAVYDRFIECFQHGIDSLTQRLTRAMEGRKKVKAEEYIAAVLSGVSQDIIGVLGQVDDKDPVIRRTVDDFLKYNASNWGVGNMARVYPGREDLQLQDKDTVGGYNRTADAFSFVTEPIKWIEDIEEYDPSGDNGAILYKNRAGNSETLKHSVKDLEQKLSGMKAEDPMYDQTKRELENARTAFFGLNTGGELARIYASEMKNKDKVSFGELYEMLSTLNQSVLQGDTRGGKLRGKDIANININSIGSFGVSVALCKTLSRVAEGIEQVKQVEDPALRKTRALQLAAFSYQMLMSEHAFADGNGRTCRLFTDTILQTFGLPPHTPLPEEMNMAKTMGEPMDFKAGTVAIYRGVRQSAKLLRKEKAKERIREEKAGARHSLFTKVREGMAEEDEKIVGSEEYRNYIRAVEKLDERMEELSRLDDQGKEKNLSAEERELLLADMTRVAETGEHFLDTCKEKGKDTQKGIYAVVNRLQDKVSKEFDTVKGYDPEKACSLNELLENSRPVTVDLRNRKIKRLGNLSSSRIPMTIRGANGRIRTGVFTKASYVRVKAHFEDILKDASKYCGPEGREELRQIPRKILDKLVALHKKKRDGSVVRKKDGTDYAIGYFLGNAFTVAQDNGSSKLSDTMAKRLLKTYGVRVEIFNGNVMNKLISGINEMVKNPSNEIMAMELQLKDGTRLDQRNSAMSVVAGLLGCGSLLARSDSMRCIDEKGELVEGTFMDFGRGIDLGNDASLARHLNRTPLSKSAHKNKVLRELSDLQVIDYLCLNVDRHEGNVMYQVDAEGNVTGIQGIDNDSSFGNRTASSLENNRLRVISATMEDRIRKLTPEMLRFSLRDRGLTESEINQSVLRLDELKLNLQAQLISVVPDDGFAGLKEQDYASMGGKLSVMQRVTRHIAKAARARVNGGIPFEAYQEKQVVLSKVSSTDRQYTIGGLSDLSERTGRMLRDAESGFDVSAINTFGRRSEEFNRVLEAVQQAGEVSRNLLAEGTLGDENALIADAGQQQVLQAYDRAFNSMRVKVTDYLRKKTNQRGLDEKGRIKAKNPYEKSRIEYAEKLLSIAKEYENRKAGPVKYEGQKEKQDVIRRRNQTARNKGAGMGVLG